MASGQERSRGGEHLRLLSLPEDLYISQALSSVGGVTSLASPTFLSAKTSITRTPAFRINKCHPGTEVQKKKSCSAKPSPYKNV